MKISRLVFIISCIIVGVWVAGLALRLVGWILNSLLYIAAVIVIVGVVRYWWESRNNSTSKQSSKVIEGEVVDKK